MKHIRFGGAVVVNEEEEEEGGGDSSTPASTPSPAAQQRQRVCEVKFGLLKERHTYTQDFLAPCTSSAAELSALETTGNAELVLARVPEDELAAKGVQPAPQGSQWLRATLFAARKGALCEVFATSDAAAAAADSVVVVVRVTGSVMGVASGTPSLRAGVHCVGVAPVTESEVDSGPEFRADPRAYAARRQHQHQHQHHQQQQHRKAHPSSQLAQQQQQKRRRSSSSRDEDDNDDDDAMVVDDD